MPTINILGTDYKLDFDYKSKVADGETQFYNKEIAIKPVSEILDEEATDDEKHCREKEVIRHEVWHAAFYEMGMEKYAYDEDLVQLLAIQSPKIFKIFNSLEAL